MDARTETERAIFKRWYDGLAARKHVDPEVVAWLAYCRGARISSETNYADRLERSVLVDISHMTDERDVLLHTLECPWITMYEAVCGVEIIDSYAVVNGQRLLVPQTGEELDAYFASRTVEV
jgi:hypothetical protein